MFILLLFAYTYHDLSFGVFFTCLLNYSMVLKIRLNFPHAPTSITAIYSSKFLCLQMLPLYSYFENSKTLSIVTISCMAISIAKLLNVWRSKDHIYARLNSQYLVLSLNLADWFLKSLTPARIFSEHYDNSFSSIFTQLNSNSRVSKARLLKT